MAEQPQNPKEDRVEGWRPLVDRADSFNGVREALEVAGAHEANPDYRKYINDVLKPFVAAEHAFAEEAAAAYRDEMEGMTEPDERTRRLVEEIGVSQREARLILQDDDLWRQHEGGRYPFEGEQAVREWNQASQLAGELHSMITNLTNLGCSNRAIDQLAAEAQAIAVEALRRARERVQAE
jgi:Asp-tRNA(Asn)/Glu-tRNA(Gln) amidotransferase B subunit